MKNIIYLFLSIITLQTQAQNNFKISGGNLKISDDVTIVLQNTNWVNNATVTANDGTVVLSGNAVQSNSSINGSSETTFHNLTVNKSANNAQLSQHIIVSNGVTLQSGNLDLTNSNLDLEGAYTLNNGHYFQTSGSGSLIREITNGTTKTFPIGNSTSTPMTIVNNGIADDFYVRSTPEVLENGTSGSAYNSGVVNRTWFIEEATAGGSDLTLTAQWNAADELTGFDRNDCAISHYTSSWDMPGGAVATGSNPYSISRSGITNLSPFAVFTEFILPIELVDFYAFQEGQEVQLEWRTASEINSDYFEIEHSTNGIDFREIGIVNALGFSNAELKYDFLHKTPAEGINYYRLKMNDLDGSFEYSDIRSVNISAFENLDYLSLYPNPTSIGNFTINITSENVETTSLTIHDQMGRLIRQVPIQQSKTQVDISDLVAGVYLIQIDINKESIWKRLIIQ